MICQQTSDPGRSSVFMSTSSILKIAKRTSTMSGSPVSKPFSSYVERLGRV